MQSSSRAVWGYAWVSSGLITKTLAHLVALALLSRSLSHAEFGEVGLIVAMYNLAWSTVEVAIGYTVVRLPTRRLSFVHTLFTVSLASGLLIAAILVASAPLFASFYGMQSQYGPMLLLAVAVVFRSGSLVAEFRLYKESKFDVLTKNDLAGHGGFLVALVACITTGYPYWALPAAYGAYMVVKSALNLRAEPHSKSVRIYIPALRSIANFVAGFGGTSLLAAIANEADKFVVGRAIGLGGLGIYGRAVQLFMLPASVIGQAVDSVLTSMLARERNNLALHQRAYYSTVEILSVGIFPLAIIIWQLAPEIVEIVLGPNWVAVVLPLQILSISTYFRVSMKVGESVLRARGLVWRRMAVYGAYGVVLIVVLIVGARVAGLVGVAWAAAVCNILFYFMMLVAVAKEIQLSWLHLIKLHLRGVLLAALLFALSLPLLHILRTQFDSALIIAPAYLALSAAAGLLATLVIGSRVMLGENVQRVLEQLYGLVARKKKRSTS